MISRKTMRKDWLVGMLSFAAAATLALSMMGCSATPKDSAPEGPPFAETSDTRQDAEAPNIADEGRAANSTVLDSADAAGIVVGFDNSGLTLRPDEGDNQTGVISLEENGKEQRFEYVENCEFVRAKGSISTGEVFEEPASMKSIKKDAMVYIHLGSNGLAQTVAIFEAI
ncbi:hypothetical protein GMI69_00770 [Eggerthellaceae bacterium zg-887]|nr:hypothetical protein [Xiamenia xianingshaonis]